MNKPELDYQGRWPFEPTAAEAATDIGADDDTDPHRASRGIGFAVLVGVCVFSLFAALFVVALGVKP